MNAVAFGKVLGILVAKDLRRARRNPVPYLIQLGLPLLITGLLGMVFSGVNQREGGGATGLGRIRLILVDEDDSPLTRLLRGALNQGSAGEHLDVSFLDRSNALARLTENQASAAVLIPPRFTADYLAGGTGVQLEVVKNPAQQFHPAIVEELTGVVTTALSALARNFRPDLDAWRQVLTNRSDVSLRRIGELLIETGERWNQVRLRLDPVPVWYEEEQRSRADDGTGTGTSTGTGAGAGKGAAPGWNMFAYLLPGLAAMFLMFLADVAMRDLHRELRFRTFDRCCTLPVSPLAFVLSKVLFTFLVTLLGAAILLGGGSFLFGFRWVHPVAVGVLAASMALFSSGLMASAAGVFPGERRADLLNALLAMGLGLAGGCAFPAQALPPFLRDHVTPHLPPNWFLEAVRSTQSGAGSWLGAAAWTSGVGLALAVLAAVLLRRGLGRGGRA